MREQYVDFAMRFQQLTSPVTAKGVEDTAFYRSIRLVALNEVGGDPGRFGTTVEEFHRQNARRAAHHPRALLATATHDMKRGEDVRARLAVLSEIPDEWRAALGALVAAQPQAARPGHAAGRVPALPDAGRRLAGRAARRRARRRRRWPRSPSGSRRICSRPRARPSCARAGPIPTPSTRPRWSASCAGCSTRRRSRAFLATCAASRAASPRRRSPTAWPRPCSRRPRPGVPDTYQGTELWDLSLVDPDNRRPVDFAARAAVLRALDDALAGGTPRERARRRAARRLARRPDQALRAGDAAAPRRGGRLAGATPTRRSTRWASTPSTSSPTLAARRWWSSRGCRARWPASAPPLGDAVGATTVLALPGRAPRATATC